MAPFKTAVISSDICLPSAVWNPTKDLTWLRVTLLILNRASTSHQGHMALS